MRLFFCCRAKALQHHLFASTCFCPCQSTGCLQEKLLLYVEAPGVGTDEQDVSLWTQMAPWYKQNQTNMDRLVGRDMRTHTNTHTDNVSAM